MEDIKAQLKEQLAAVEWNLLMPHAKRDAVIVVNEGLNLVDVGVAIANDNSVSVQNWISEQLVYKPSSVELNSWNNEPSKQFMSLIVQPFVLVQETPEGNRNL